MSRVALEKLGAIALGALLLGAACGDGGSTLVQAPAPAGELWLLQTRVYSPEATTGYAILTGALDGDIGNENAIEQFGGGWVYAPPGQPDGSFLLSHGERGEVIRYQVTADDRLVEGARLSFASYGVQSGYGIVAWVDAHTAYWFDSAQLQAIRFDPTDMEIDRALSIDGVTRDGYRAWFSDHPVVREDGVFISMNWSSSWDVGSVPSSPAGSMLVHIDPATDEVRVLRDERCTSLLTSMTTPDGDTYFFSSYENAYVRIATGGAGGVPDCALRVRKDQSELDPDWYLDLTQRTAGRPVDGVLPGAGYSMWSRVFYADRVQVPPSDFETVDTALAWQWSRLDVDADGPAVESTQLPFSTHGTAGVQAQGRSFFMLPNDDYSQSHLLELEGDAFVERASVVGELNTLLRVR